MADGLARIIPFRPRTLRSGQLPACPDCAQAKASLTLYHLALVSELRRAEDRGLRHWELRGDFLCEVEPVQEPLS